MSWRTFVSVFIPFPATFFAMAALALRPDTTFARRMLLPFTLTFALRAVLAFDPSGGDPAKANVNQPFYMMAFMMSMRCIDWAIRKEPLTRSDGASASTKHKIIHRPARPTRLYPSQLFWDTCDLATNLRGIGWAGYPTTYIPQSSRSVTRTPFLRQTLLSLCLHACLCDALQHSVQFFSPDTFGSPAGGTIFDSALPPMARYARSTLTTLLFGWSIYAIAQATYDFATIVAVLVLRQRPAQWPPLFDAPWRATSLAELWGRRWHQSNRIFLIGVGAKPASYVFGRAGGVLGAFALSGVMHDFGLRAVGRGSDFGAVVGFFVVMGVGALLEALWARAFGGKGRGSGWLGWLWTVGWVTGWGNMLVEAWLTRGAAGTTVFPPLYSPTKLAVALVTDWWL
ncbi:hypothetical protein BV22DRAFT_1039001 [Leucogyrophana mollusca]|uniref:Uncharacterized protein n=1 Tax=Leucogyrophana mollusca TaxID=85980 RepID=A0ACB8B6N8_9AGAM|nr:hypothetical protein BV22DRAFT_1039001 [Leucogyrophana mollusca]